MDGLELKEVCLELHVEVALVFTYNWKEFKFPTNDVYLHITNNQKEMLMKAQVPNIENPGQVLEELYKQDGQANKNCLKYEPLCACDARE